MASTIRYPLLRLDYQIPVTQLKGPKADGDMGAKGNGDMPNQKEMEICKLKGSGDMQAAKRDQNAPPTGGRYATYRR